MQKATTVTSPLLHFFCLVIIWCRIWLMHVVVAQNSSSIPVNVGVVLDLDTKLGKTGLSCINMALSDFYATHASYRTRLVLNPRDSKGVIGAAAAALDLIKNVQVQAIIGPQTSMQANFLINLGNKSQVPIISFSATSPSLTSLRSPYFFRATQNDSSQVKAISAIVVAFGWREAVPIYIDDEFGEGIIPYLTDALQGINVRVPYQSVIPSPASDDQISKELYKLLTMQTRVFIVHMPPSLGTRLFALAKEVGMMSEGYAWIVTDGMTNLWSLTDPPTIDSMQGVLGVRTYVPGTNELENFKVRWKRKFQQDNPTIINAELNIFGPWAYDATFALAMAIENVSMGNFSFNKTNVSSSGTDLESLDVSQNGDTTSPPKGWEIPTNEKKLRIGVPMKGGFSEFVKVTWDPNSHTATSVTGYCIDVFDAVMAAMPYAVTYEFIPFATPDGKSAGTYDDLIFQVYNGTYDAVVGDTTIVANRSQYVDFTLPYTESGVSMFVPIRDNRRKNAWVFLKPLTWDLWVTSACFFLFIGFVVWVLEHRINEDFRGPPSHQAGTSFWFSFSTMVFAHRERVVSNLARFVVIIWCFVVLILTQSYTASLTSLLTVQQLQPTVTDIQELLKKGEKVGFLKDSFIEGILKGRFRFPESQLIEYQSPEELHDLFTKGSANGGVVATLDEIPYMKLFLAKYCYEYTAVEPKLRTDGFGFVFPRGSPLVADVSRAVLNVTEGEKMNQIEQAWFNKGSSCPDLNTLVSSNSLGVESFGGLFLIAGVASISALIIFAAIFFYEQRHVLLHFDSETPFWRRIQIMSRIFDQKDLSSHTFRKSELEDKSRNDSVHSISVAGDSPNTNCPPSPSSYSNQTEPDFVFLADQRRVAENGDITPSVTASPEIFPFPERHSIELGNTTNGPRE
ncbi:Glutamate receptor 2.9 [Theobroma cacao]|uniref:Glutamate receptor n=1 Tax=Theobroma cacao TaxID=3641 RepID=A0A061GJD5_THECC|nr:Glutamate receptor 2.9 [Theobroma cacao]